MILLACYQKDSVRYLELRLYLEKMLVQIVRCLPAKQLLSSPMLAILTFQDLIDWTKARFLFLVTKAQNSLSQCLFLTSQESQASCRALAWFPLFFLFCFMRVVDFGPLLDRRRDF